MRISDWSSDVCSSDLELHPVAGIGERRIEQPLRGAGDRGGAHERGEMQTRGIPVDADFLRADDGQRTGRRRLALSAREQDRAGRGRFARLREQIARGDRKSVVWGKSVSVRVDLGGRRSIKKKQEKK